MPVPAKRQASTPSTMSQGTRSMMPASARAVTGAGSGPGAVGCGCAISGASVMARTGYLV